MFIWCFAILDHPGAITMPILQMGKIEIWISQGKIEMK